MLRMNFRKLSQQRTSGLFQLSTQLQKEVNENLEKFELGIAVQKIYEFIWDCYCDWYIELVKTRLSSDGEDAQNARQVLLYVLDQILRLLHPFMPYITEEIWQTIPHEGETVMLAKYPEYNAELDYPEASDEMKKLWMQSVQSVTAVQR